MYETPAFIGESLALFIHICWTLVLISFNWVWWPFHLAVPPKEDSGRVQIRDIAWLLTILHKMVLASLEVWVFTHNNLIPFFASPNCLLFMACLYLLDNVWVIFRNGQALPMHGMTWLTSVRGIMITMGLTEINFCELWGLKSYLDDVQWLPCSDEFFIFIICFFLGVRNVEMSWNRWCEVN